ncbi:MAG: DUF1211 domain-containing protein [Dehalococcoidia bacterium]|nr:DUF1211 domain-containing protein [Dehalococcoidia bacterium]
MESNERISPNHEKILGRLLSLSDGIFAFAITLLILNIVLPYGTSRADVPQALLELWPKYLAFLISFVVIGLYWIVHVRQFRVIRKYDTGLLWLNLLFLMFIVLIPFSTGVLSDFEETASVVLYAANMACAGFTATGLWIYATRRKLVDAKLGPAWVRRGIIMNLIAPGWFALSIGLAFINANLAVYSWLLIGVAHRVVAWIFKLPKPDEDI